MTDTVGCGVRFERIRRITGYLVGTTDRFNNAKRAEERDRVKHCSMDADLKNVGRGGAGFRPGLRFPPRRISTGAEVPPGIPSGAAGAGSPVVPPAISPAGSPEEGGADHPFRPEKDGWRR